MFFAGEPAAHAPRKITHVGLSLGGWKIIHSSRSNNGVYEDDIQAVEHLRTTFCGARTFTR
jgi:gamma-D-glutamyl-L-lysine dipeptidyl-peptidase